jgi:hypothetical protein
LERGANLYHEDSGNLPLQPTDIEADPLFEVGNFFIMGDSPALDAGRQDVPLWLDIQGEYRLMGAGVDIGADELLQLPEFAFTVVPAEQTVDPGIVASYTYSLTNTGSFRDSYTISQASVTTGGTGWAYAVAPEAVVDLLAGQTATGTLTVTGSIDPGYVATTTLTALSSGTLGITQTATAVTRISQTADLRFTPDNSGTGLAGQTVTYAHVLTNTGNGPDSFSFTYASSQGWTASLAPQTTILLLPNQSQELFVTVQIPAGTAVGTIDTLVITATSQADTACLPPSPTPPQSPTPSAMLAWN